VCRLIRLCVWGSPAIANIYVHIPLESIKAVSSLSPHRPSHRWLGKHRQAPHTPLPLRLLLLLAWITSSPPQIGSLSHRSSYHHLNRVVVAWSCATVSFPIYVAGSTPPSTLISSRRRPAPSRAALSFPTPDLDPNVCLLHPRHDLCRCRLPPRPKHRLGIVLLPRP
jgi:hypothetical protein